MIVDSVLNIDFKFVCEIGASAQFGTYNLWWNTDIKILA